ncbi:MAG TPA: hypothetical protein VMH22_14070 [bacterium]|nr:hypothetical protein [bacterium]
MGSDIIGRVAAKQRGARRRAIAGGWQGLAYLRCVRLGQAVRKHAGLVPHTLYDFAARLGPLDSLLPRSLLARLVRFDAHYRVFLKLLMGSLVVGEYDDQRDQWHIRRPFRLFVDARVLLAAVSSSFVTRPSSSTAAPQPPTSNPPSQ